jgi:RNA 2',3'-cyclic 3'-phosphodiesterase
VRLFVAADLPAPARAACAAWRDRVAGAQLRPVRDAALHVTLVFIGQRPDEDAEALAAALVQGCARRLRLGTARWLPRRRPAVLAAGVEDLDGELAALQARTAAAVGIDEDRGFLPHVTVARVRRGARVRPVDLPPPSPVEFAAESVTLYASTTAPGGARYDVVRRLPCTRT